MENIAVPGQDRQPAGSAHSHQNSTTMPHEHDREENSSRENIGREDTHSDDPMLVRQPSSDREPRQHRILVLPEVVVFLYFLALVTQYPIIQFWLFDHFSREYNLEAGNDSSPCSNSSESNSTEADLEKKVQTKSNNYIMYTSFIGNFVAIFPTLLLGPVTDRYGRKFVFYISFSGIFTSLLLNLFVFQFNLAPVVLCVSSFFMGLSGSYGLFLVACFGMVADITSPGKQRAFRVTTTEAAIAIAMSIATSTAGIWVKETGYVWPMAVSMGEVVLAFIFALFFLPETLLERHNRSFSCRILLRSFKFYVKDTVDKRRFRLIVYLACFLIMMWSAIGESNFSTLFLLHRPFCWPKVQISVFSGVITLLKWLTVVVTILLGKRCISEPVFALLGSVSGASGYLLKGLAKSDAMIFIGAGTSLFMDLVGPMCRTMLSKSVSRNEQGALFAGIGVLQMIVSAVSGVVMSLIYGVGINVFMGLPYLVLGGLLLLNVLMLIAAIIQGRRHPPVEQPTDDDEKLIS